MSCIGHITNGEGFFEPAVPSLNNKAAKTNKQTKKKKKKKERLYKGNVMHSVNNIFPYMEILFLIIVQTFSVMGNLILVYFRST